MRLGAVGIAAAMGVAALSLVGGGAFASVLSGPGAHHPKHPLDVVLSAQGATGNGTPDITLGSLGPTGSSFMTVPTLITITNEGTIPAGEVALGLSDVHSSPALLAETWVCFYSDGGILFNEPLSTVEAYGKAAIGKVTLPPGATDTYTAVFYAGPAQDTGCGTSFTGYQAVPFDGYQGGYYSTESYTGSAPTRGPNSAAGSLTNAAEGGSLVPKVTISYVGASTLTQVAPLGATVTVEDSATCSHEHARSTRSGKRTDDDCFGDWLAVSGATGDTTYVVTSPDPHLNVSPRGEVTTVGGPLTAGTYTASGTVTDRIGDTGTWSYTLTVTTGTMRQAAPFQRSVTVGNSGSSFVDQLVLHDAVGAVTYAVTTPSSSLMVSTSGAVTTVGGPLSHGIYVVSGTATDAYGDTGTWSYSLKVTHPGH